VFDRFLARIVAVLRESVLLKGGFVFEPRLDRARTTKDIDLRLIGSPETVLADLQKAGRQVLGDFMTFEVTRDTEQPKIQNDGMKYEGLGFRAECLLAGKLYGRAFGVEVAFGDPILGEPEIVAADDVLEFAGIAPTVVRLQPVSEMSSANSTVPPSGTWRLRERTEEGLFSLGVTVLLKRMFASLLALHRTFGSNTPPTVEPPGLGAD
jgi:hypothetical protein